MANTAARQAQQITETYDNDLRMACQRSLTSHPVYNHINETWDKLTFGHDGLFLGGAKVPLVAHTAGKPYFVYISDKEDLETVRALYRDVRADLIKKGHKAEDLLDIEVRRLPRDGNGKYNIPFDEHGILHLPCRGISPGLHRYTPGTQYNWDTAFIIRGLVQDGKMDLAFDVLTNLMYEIEHYDGPLNANVTFSIGDDKPRSQLPLISAKILMVYNKWDELSNPPADKNEWLKYNLSLLEKHYQHWVTGAHLDEETGLSRFNSYHERPGVEVMHCEPEHYQHAYEALHEMWEQHSKTNEPVNKRSYQARKDAYYVAHFLQMDPKTNMPVPFQIDKKTDFIQGLSPLFFRADWAMRESGFDPSRRFGFLNADIIHHLAVCLNSLRYKMAKEISEGYRILKGVSSEASRSSQWASKEESWSAEAKKVKTAIHKYLWDDASPQTRDDDPSNPEDPMYPCFRDRNINPCVGEDDFDIGVFRRYNFAATAFAPLWAELASQEQADLIMKYTYPLLKTPYGIKTSTRRTGCQWDDPIIWAPLVTMAAVGMEKYGFYKEALELANSYTAALEAEFERSGAVYEKIEGIGGTCNTGQYIGKGVGYNDNDKGFGWTNAAYIELKIALVRLEMKLANEE